MAAVVVAEAVEDLVVVPHVVEVAAEVPLGEEPEAEQTVSRLVLEVLGPIRRRHLTIKSNENQPPIYSSICIPRFNHYWNSFP